MASRGHPTGFDSAAVVRYRLPRSIRWQQWGRSPPSAMAN